MLVEDRGGTYLGSDIRIELSRITWDGSHGFLYSAEKRTSPFSYDWPKIDPKKRPTVPIAFATAFSY